TAPASARTTAPATVSRARRLRTSRRAFATRRSTGSMHRCYGTRDPGALLGLGHGGVEDLDGAADQVSLDRQRGDQLEAVVEVATLLEEEAFADALVEDPRRLLGGGLLHLAVAHELEPDEETARVDPAQDRMALPQLLEALAEVNARLGCSRDNAFALVCVQGCIGSGRSQRRRRKGGHVRARAPR